MMMAENDRPWFIRVKRAGRCNLRPNSRAGWMITGLYVAVVSGISLFLLGGSEPSLPRWIAWAAVMTAATSALLFTAWRTSALVEGESGNCGRRATGPSLARNVLAGLLAAAAIIGAALLGVDF